MELLRRANDRGATRVGWLDSRHTFSFGDYFDPKWVHFGGLRVINDDRVAPGGGFPFHGHRDMEIVSYVVEGGLAHRDSLGNTGVVRAGDVQRMSAGTGISHSEYNESDTKALRFLQIWIPPARAGLPPSYEQKSFDAASRSGRLALLISPDGAEGSLRIHQDAWLYGALLAPAQSVRHGLAEGRKAWVQVVRGAVKANGHDLEEGDGLGLADVDGVEIAARADAELLVFDLP